MPPPNDQPVHPLKTYLTNQKNARDKLVVELNRLKVNSAEGDAKERADAVRDGPLLTSELRHFDDEHELFLLNVFTKTTAHGPADAVVEETRALNASLAAAIVKANHSSLMLKILTGYLNGAIAVFNGKVPPSAAGAKSDGSAG